VKVETNQYYWYEQAHPTAATELVVVGGGSEQFRGLLDFHIDNPQPLLRSFQNDAF
jgi:hypothetical protein